MKMHAETYVMESGERCALLLDPLGMPIPLPTLYITTQIRNSGKSVATSEQCLASIKILLEFCSTKQIDLNLRIQTEIFLLPGEIAELCDQCRLRHQLPQAGNVFSLKKGYTRPLPKVKTSTTYLYIGRIAAYIKWLCQYHLRAKRFTKDTARKIQAFVDEILERRPLVNGRNIDDEAYRGLSSEQEDLLFTVMCPGNANNPFIDSRIQIRNYLIVKLLRLLGSRGGELLNIQVRDFDFVLNQLRIVRRADASEDHRANQPRVKTQQRVLPLVQSTMDEVRYYIVEVRKRIPNAARDPYLFITHKSGPTQGRAMSKSSLYEIFHTVAHAHPCLAGVTAHDLRHRWNVVYSERMDSQSDHSHAEVEQWRNFLAGWTTGSMQGQHYMARHVRSKAHAAMRDQQEQFERNVRVTIEKK